MRLAIAVAVSLLLAPLASAGNDDSCDISVAPAATLLLPYFQVDISSPEPKAHTTLFTVTNVSPYPQIAHVVLWTDWSYPVLDFNLWLTGYDVQSINLHDVLSRGVIAPIVGDIAGTSFQNGPSIISPVGGNPSAMNASPYGDASNPNHDHSGSNLDVSIACMNQPGFIADALLADVKGMLTTGNHGSVLGAGCSGKVGAPHALAIGYVTIDVVNTCTTSFPGPTASGETYSSQHLLFDNVLIGDYQDVSPDGNYAGGNTLVHIRAVPEGGPAHSFPGTNLPYTFYDRFNLGGNEPATGVPYTSGTNRLIDRRQPLPATFAASWIEGGSTGFQTNYKIWREGLSGPSSGCGTSSTDLTTVSVNSQLVLTELVRFDEHENANTWYFACQILCPPVYNTLQAVASRSTMNTVFPASTGSGDVKGWMYFNLDHRGHYGTFSGSVDHSTVYSDPSRNNPVAHPEFSRNLRPSQNWVLVSMAAEGRYSVDFDAAALGNGCSPTTAPGVQIRPAGGIFVCPSLANCVTAANYYGYTNTTPKAGEPRTGTLGTNVTP